MIKDLYTILEQHEEELCLKLANASHPHFQAHFPQYPLLAGFALIDIIAQILEDKIIVLKNTKFTAPIFPNDTINCHIQTQKHRKQRSIKIFKSEKKVSEIRYEYL